MSLKGFEFWVWKRLSCLSGRWHSLLLTRGALDRFASGVGSTLNFKTNLTYKFLKNFKIGKIFECKI